MKTKNHIVVFTAILFKLSCSGSAESVINKDSKLDATTEMQLDANKDFTIQFRVKTNSKNPTVLVSKKRFPDKSIRSQQIKDGFFIHREVPLPGTLALARHD